MSEVSLEQLSRLLEQALAQTREIKAQLTRIGATIATKELVESLCAEGEAQNRQAAARIARLRVERGGP